MLSLLLVAICSLTIVLVLTPLFRDFFGFLGIVDRPDSERKNHSRPIPRVGGIALAVGYSGTMAAIALGWWFGGIHLASDPTIQLVVRLLPAVVIIFCTGLIDDVWGLPPKYKLAGQCVAASYACWIGVRLAAPSGNSGWTIVIDLVSIFWLVLCANAFNLIDGMDGLAAGIGLIAAVSLLMAAIIHHHPGLALAIAPLIGGLFGFLYYNFNPASIFLGDCGSLLVGFLLGCYGLLWNQKATTGLGGLAPLAALALPVLEVMLSIARRYLRTRPIFGADGNHIHHRMLGLGLSPRASTLVLYSVSATAALVAVLQTILRPQLMSVLFLMATALAYVGLRTLRYPEFGALSRFLFAGDFRRALRTRIYLQEYEESLAAASTVDDCWRALRNSCRENSFSYVALRVGSQHFEAELQPLANPAWRLQIALSRSDTAIFEHDPKLPGPAMLIAPLVQRLQAKLLGGIGFELPASGVPRLEQAKAGGVGIR